MRAQCLPHSAIAGMYRLNECPGSCDPGRYFMAAVLFVSPLPILITKIFLPEVLHILKLIKCNDFLTRFGVDFRRHMRYNRMNLYIQKGPVPREKNMKITTQAQQVNQPDEKRSKKIERENNRWMLLIYDTLAYIICWFAIFVLHPSVKMPLPETVMYFYLIAGYVLVFVLRLLMKVYKQIWRYGTIRSIVREGISCLLASAVLVAFCLLFRDRYSFAKAPVITVVSFAAVYIIFSVSMRILYSYLYRFAEKNTALAKTVRLLIRKLCFVDFESKTPGAILRLVLEPEKTSRDPINEIQNVVEKFAIRGEATSITQINKGYINRTYRVETLSDAGHVHKYTLQRINTNVFPDVDVLMDNFKLTTNHLYGKFHLPGSGKKGSVQTVRPTKDGRSYLRDDSGCWRVMTHFDNVYSLDIPDCPETFYHTGHAFGSFLKEMSDVDVSEVKEVIPNFHNTMSRYLDLEKAIAADPKGRVKSVKKEIEFVRSRVNLFSMISEALDSGKIPVRICHNDCNLNNILFDNETHLPVAIIDLDTVMPSSPLYDYGDSMRIGTNTATDDEKDLSKVSCDLNLYEQYARGYLEACGDILTEEELKLLPYASLIITSEDGIRFLMDYINGDTYYNIYYPGQNLDRSRTQLKLLEDMEKKLPEIKKILQRIYNELGLKVKLC